MKKALAIGMAIITTLSIAACGSGSTTTTQAANNTASESTAGEATTDLPEWPGTDKEITFYTRNNTGTSVALAQQYLIDTVIGDEATAILVSDGTSGGAVCVEKTYAAGGDGYTFYNSGNEMVIGDILGTFDYSLRDDFQVLGMIPSNGAPNFLSVSKVTLPEIQTMEDLIAYCQEHPGEVRFGYSPDTLGEVYVTLFTERFDLDVKMTISEGQDSKPNLMGGIVDVVIWNQNDTLEYMVDYITPLVALSNNPSTKEDLKDITTYADKDMSDCVVPSYMFLVCNGDIDPALAEAINAKWNAAIEEVLSDNPTDENAQMLKEHMETQDQFLQALTIEECEAIIEQEYEAITAVFGDR